MNLCKDQQCSAAALIDGGVVAVPTEVCGAVMSIR
jgi:hypothetical protein